jgi:hypothetical protein
MPANKDDVPSKRGLRSVRERQWLRLQSYASTHIQLRNYILNLILPSAQSRRTVRRYTPDQSREARVSRGESECQSGAENDVGGLAGAE